MNEEYSLKEELLFDYNDYSDVKHPNKKKKKKYCPFCDNEMKPNIYKNGFVYCNVCHERLPWKAYLTDETPVKEVKI
jgi:ribosomal protein L37AE/L43A